MRLSNFPLLISFRGARYVLADEQQKLERFLASAQKAFIKLLATDGAAVSLAKAALEKYPGKEKAAREYWIKHARGLDSVKGFLGKFDPTGSKQTVILQRIRDAVFGGNQSKVWEKLHNTIFESYVAWKQEKAKEPLYQTGLPEDVVRKLFPKSFAVDVDPDRNIVQEFEVFGSEKRSLERKRRSMLKIIENWNRLTEQVNKDLQAEDPQRRLTALVTSLIMATGIRVGGGRTQLKDESGKAVKDEEGNPVYMDTFGATTLKPEHIKFIRDDYMLIEFPGKAGTVNIAGLSDPQIVAAIKEQLSNVKDTLSGEADKSELLFRTKDGRKVSGDLVNAYIQRILGPEVSAHSFRHLKATETFFSRLKARESHLAKKLLEIKKAAIDDLRGHVVSEIYNALWSTAEETREMLSHEDVGTTLEYYIHPRVILNFLSGAGLDKALDVVVGEGRGLKLKFDPVEFVVKMQEKVQERHTAKVFTGNTTFFLGDKFVEYDVDDAILDLIVEEE